MPVRAIPQAALSLFLLPPKYSAALVRICGTLSTGRRLRPTAMYLLRFIDMLGSILPSGGRLHDSGLHDMWSAAQDE